MVIFWILRLNKNIYLFYTGYDKSVCLLYGVTYVLFAYVTYCHMPGGISVWLR